jgi:uncharacterized DUF497 family protein
MQHNGVTQNRGNSPVTVHAPPEAFLAGGLRSNYTAPRGGCHVTVLRLTFPRFVCTMICMMYEWDESKERENIEKHGISFETACRVFLDPLRIVTEDKKHSIDEARYFAVGEVDGRVLTVRFTMRGASIRIFGAGYWRREKAYYEQKYNIGR